MLPILPAMDRDRLERQVLTQPFEFCRGITETHKKEAERFLQIAVNAGQLEALKVYAVSLDDPSRAIPLWEAVWRQGDISGLYHLQFLHRFPRTPGEAPLDSVTGAAYLLLNSKLVELRLDHGSSATRNEVVNQALMGLSPRDYEAAIALAKKLLAENDNCCLLFPH